MRTIAWRTALSGVMAALGVVLMTLGTLVPVMTFCAPALAGLALIPPLFECGRKWALCVYAAVALISLGLSPDREAALLFLFLGWYPAAKPSLDKLRRRPLRILLKLALFNAGAALTLLSAVFLFGMSEVLTEYMEMSKALLIAFVIVANLSMLAYDLFLNAMALFYLRKLRRLIRKQ